MWVRKLRVVNVGPFEDFSADLVRGSVGVFGRNGRGKSTLVNLIYGIITNDFGRFAGVRADMVRNTADPKAESYAWGEIEHNGRVLEITRNFKPTRAKPGTLLVVDGNKAEALTDTGKAEAAIEEVLGVSGKLLALYVFKEQDKIYDFLTSLPSERAKAYAKLCRTEDCEEIWDMLGEFLNKDRELNTEIVDNSDELTAELSELEAQAKSLAEQRETAAKKLCEPKPRKRYEEVVADARRLDALREQIARAEAAATLAEQVRDKKAGLAEEAEAELKEVAEKHDKRRAKANDTRAALRGLDAYKKYRKQRRTLRDEAEALADEAKRNRPPEPPTGADQLAVIQKELAAERRSLADATAYLKEFGESGKMRCPTCQTPVADLSETIATAKFKVKSLPGTVRSLEDKVERIETYHSALRKYEKWKAGYDARVVANQKSQAGLEDVTAPDGDETELKAWLDKFEKLEAARTQAEKAYTAADRARTEAVATHKAKASHLADLTAEAAEIEVDPDKLAKATRRLAEHVAAGHEVARLEGEEKGVANQTEARKAELKRLKTKLARTRRVRQMARVISESRDVVHRDRLQRRVATLNLARMEGDINENLAAFGDPFWVEASHDLSFVANKPGEPPQPAARLSTGQRVILALAFWPAVASLWSTELGMLALDEPTANLDADNRKCLRDALAGMTARVRGDRQVIMVTHDPDLRTAFDQVIDLGG